MERLVDDDSPLMSARKKTVLFVGSFLSKNKGTKGISEKMGPFIEADYNLCYASRKVNKVLRLIDVLWCILSKRYDVVHSDVFSGQAFWVSDVARRIARLRNKKLILNIRGGRFLEYLCESSLRLRVFRSWVHSGTILISPSHFLAEGLKEKFGISVKVVPNFIDLQKFPYDSSERKGFQLLWVRAFNSGYRPEIAVDALKHVRAKYPKATLTMVGPDKGTFSSTKELVGTHDLTDWVTFTGPVPNTELKDFFHSHDVYLNTTTYESFGQAVFEAAACGIPIVSTKVGELPFVWKNEEDIIFCEQQTGASLCDAILRVFDDRGSMAECQRKARELAEKYTWKNVRKAWTELLG